MNNPSRIPAKKPIAKRSARVQRTNQNRMAHFITRCQRRKLRKTKKGFQKMEYTIPCFRGLLKLCKKLDLHVEFRLYGPKDKEPIFQSFAYLGNIFNREKLVALMTAAYDSERARHAPAVRRQSQLKRLQKVRRERDRILWSNIYRFFSDCGYRLDVWLAETPTSMNKWTRSTTE